MWFIIRHGQTLSNSLGLNQGQLETLLTLRGIVQSQSVGYRLLNTKEDFSKYTFVSSPLVRARHTLQIIAETLNLKDKELLIDNSIINRNKGIFQGLSTQIVKEKYPEEYEKHKSDDWNYIPPQGKESKHDFYLRIKKFVDENKDKENMVIVTHASITRLIKNLLLNKTIDEIKEIWKEYSESQDNFFAWDGKELKEM